MFITIHESQWTNDHREKKNWIVCERICESQNLSYPEIPHRPISKNLNLATPQQENKAFIDRSHLQSQAENSFLFLII